MALTDADWTQRGLYVVLLIVGTIFVLLWSLQLRHNELDAQLERLRIQIDDTAVEADDLNLRIAKTLEAAIAASEAAARLAHTAASPETRGAGRSGL